MIVTVKELNRELKKLDEVIESQVCPPEAKVVLQLLAARHNLDYDAALEIYCFGKIHGIKEEKQRRES